MRITRITIITAGVIAAAGLLAGCGTTQSGSAVIAPTTAASVTVSSTDSLSSPTTAPTPTVTATVLVQPPVTVVQPPVVVVPPPTTVYQPPATVYQPPVNSGTFTDDQIAGDRSIAESTIGWWIPQLSSKQDSAGAMSRFLNQQATYPDEIMVWSNDYSTFASQNYYVALVPREFATAAGANAWCDSQGFSADNCFAKRLSHIDGPVGNSVER